MGALSWTAEMLIRLRTIDGGPVRVLPLGLTVALEALSQAFPDGRRAALALSSLEARAVEE